MSDFISGVVASGDIAALIILVMLVELAVLFRRRRALAWRMLPNILAGMGILAAWLVAQTHVVLALAFLAAAGAAHVVSLLR
jgi:hypothetical protein